MSQFKDREIYDGESNHFDNMDNSSPLVAAQSNTEQIIIEPPSGSDKIVGFGKHAELTFKTLAETQRGYVQWLFRQGWFHSKYPELYEYLDNAGLRPDMSVSTFIRSNPTPIDHNSFQARFTDDNELLRVVQAILFGTEYIYNITNVTFEHICNSDIVIDVTCNSRNPGWFSKMYHFTLLLELKPTVSNEYPEILRQLRSQRRSYEYFTTTSQTPSIIQQALVIGAYTGDVDIKAVRKMFGDIQIIEVSSEFDTGTE